MMHLVPTLVGVLFSTLGVSAVYLPYPQQALNTRAEAFWSSPIASHAAASGFNTFDIQQATMASTMPIAPVQAAPPLATPVTPAQVQDACPAILTAAAPLAAHHAPHCPVGAFSTASAFVPSEATRAAKHGWQMKWVSLFDGEVLDDPMDAIEALRAASTNTEAPLADYSWPQQFDRIFDAEASAFEGNSGWNDRAMLVHTPFGACRGQQQPGHFIYCTPPGGRVELTLGLANIGTQVWTNETVQVKLHQLDDAVWRDYRVTPMDLGADPLTAAEHDSSGVFHTQSAASDAYGHAVSSRQMTLHEVYAEGRPALTCVPPNSTALYTLALDAPPVTGLYELKFSVVSPCGRLAKPITAHIEVTCSDGLFCNGLEKQVNGVCQTPAKTSIEPMYGGIIGGPCDDGDACTVDTCDETLGRCTYKLTNTTQCLSGASVCGGARCTRFCPTGAECGADGCGGMCGICQTGEACSSTTSKCVPVASLAGTTASSSSSSAAVTTPAAASVPSCTNPARLNVFASAAQEAEWKLRPEMFNQGNLNQLAATLDHPSELSRHYLSIPDIGVGMDEVTPSCVSFGTRPDFIWQFVVPESSAVNRAKNGGILPVDPFQVNMDPNATGVLRRDGYIGLSVQAYGKYNPRIDTVVEVRGAPGTFASAESRAWFGTPGAPTREQLDPTYACFDDRQKLSGKAQWDRGDGTGPHTWTLNASTLEVARSYALTQPGYLDLAHQHGYPMLAPNEHPMRVFQVCNDNATPPGGLGSQLQVLLPPGTYYLIVSSFPKFNIPAEVQALHDTAAKAPPANLQPEQMNEVEAFVRFTSGYLTDCVNTACGDDGGGNDCGGGCGRDAFCTAAGGKCAPTPAACRPDCTNRTCGGDGCGGSCGTCSLASISPATRLHTSNPLGVPFANEDVYCVEARDPSLDLYTPAGTSTGSDLVDTRTPLGSASCALMPRQCDGARPVCYGLSTPSAWGDGTFVSHAGCPANTFCANDCRCLPVGTPLPDLLVKFDALVHEITISSFAFTNKSCSLVEKCINRAGMRKLLRFSVAIINQGKADLALPKPTEQPDDFLYSSCHHHFHYHHFADYSLSRDGRVVSRGHKQAFCLEDSMQEYVGRDVPCLAHHTCTQPGIQRGWSDYYGADLDCQWIDITDVEPGRYLLRIEVNSGRSLLEETFENNVVTIEVNIPPPN